MDSLIRQTSTATPAEPGGFPEWAKAGQLHPEGCELFLEALQGPLGPAALRMVATHGHDKSSRPGESHPQALTDPDVSLSTHPALIVQPPHRATASGRTTRAGPGQCG